MIYCVEDDIGTRQMLMYALEASGFSVKGFANAASFYKAAKQENPTLILLDIMLPDEDGISILKTLKQDPAWKQVPVIMTTAKGTEYDKVVGLDLGADDYLAKPFGMMEMVSRVKAVLRRVDPSTGSDTLTNGDLVLNRYAHTVQVKGQFVQLTLKEYDLLKVLMENVGRALSREQLLSLIWESDYFGGSRTVDVHVGTLRTKLGICGHYICTVRGVGYRMEPHV